MRTTAYDRGPCFPSRTTPEAAAFALGQIGMAHAIVAPQAARRADDDFGSILVQGTTGRIAGALRDGDLTPEELAGRLGAAAEVVSTALRQMQLKGAVDYRNHGKRVVRFLTPAAAAVLDAEQPRPMAALATGSAEGTESRIVAIFRSDIGMTALKLASQAGHAYLMTYLQAMRDGNPLAAGYASGSQAKISLAAPDLATLQRIKAKAEARGVTAVLVTDEGRTEFGSPTVTVLGLGPMSKTDSNSLTRGLSMRIEVAKDEMIG